MRQGREGRGNSRSKGTQASSSVWHVPGTEEIHLSYVWAMCPREMDSKGGEWAGIRASEGFEEQLVSLNFIQDLL